MGIGVVERHGDGEEKEIWTNNDSALYAHKLHTGFWSNVSNPEEFGFASKFIHLISILSKVGLLQFVKFD